MRTDTSNVESCGDPEGTVEGKAPFLVYTEEALQPYKDFPKIYEELKYAQILVSHLHHLPKFQN
jgi:hypothetical protein